MFYAIRVVYSLEYQNFIFVISSGTMAFLIGLVTVFAPSGVGVRDSILIYLLGIIMPLPIALVATVLIRILAVLSEFFLIGLAYLVDLKNNKVNE